MTSKQVNGTYSVYIVAPSGNRRLVYSSTAYWWAPGGSGDGVIANTPEKWNILPASADVGGPGYSIEITLTAGSNVTIDASDCAFILPVIVNGQEQTVGNPAHASGLGNQNFTVDLEPADVSFVAGVETPLARFRAKEGVYFQVGGNRVFMSIEDNTA